MATRFQQSPGAWEGLLQVQQCIASWFRNGCLEIGNLFKQGDEQSHPTDEMWALLPLGSPELAHGSDGLDELEQPTDEILLLLCHLRSLSTREILQEEVWVIEVWNGTAFLIAYLSALIKYFKKIVWLQRRGFVLGPTMWGRTFGK